MSNYIITSFAQTNYPLGMAFKNGILYCTNFYDNKIVQIDNNGNVTDFISDINRPRCLAFDLDGNLYVGSSIDNVIYKFTNYGLLDAIYDVPPSPFSIVINNGYLFCACFESNVIVKVNLYSGDIVNTIYGLNLPHALAINNQYLYCGNFNSGIINKISLIDLTMTTFASGYNSVSCLTFDNNNNLYVGLYDRSETYIINSNGTGNLAFYSYFIQGMVYYNNNIYINNFNYGLINKVSYNSQIPPTITNFSIPTKTYGDAPFTITQPTSNSSGSFSYTSSNTSVATISGNIITIVGAGNSIITATQAATSNYTSGTITTTFQVNQSTPTITNFSIPTKTYGDAPFTITQPTSNSSGSFSYTSSNTSVATISGNTITIVGAGTSTITATQAATSNYTSGTITTTFQVNQSTVSNPVLIETSSQLHYFLTTNSMYAGLENDINTNILLQNNTETVKYIFNDTNKEINLTKND